MYVEEIFKTIIIWGRYADKKQGKAHFTQTGKIIPPVDCGK